MPKEFRQSPFSKEVIPDVVLRLKKPQEPMSTDLAEARLAEILAQITAISRQIEDKSRSRSRPWATDPNEAWRKAATQARDELHQEARGLRDFLSRNDAKKNEERCHRNATKELTRQEIDKSTRDARKLARKKGELPLWELYLKTEVALLTIINSGGVIGPLGESLIYSARDVVPEWYRTHWLRTVYGTTWGRQAELLKK